MTKQSDIEACLEKIRQLGKSLKKVQKKITPNIVGFYGELIVWKELEKRFLSKGYFIKTGEGQTKADFVLKNNKKEIKIEVKTSRLKEEWFGKGYGYPVKIKKCQLHPKAFINHSNGDKIAGDFCYFDYLIALKLTSDDLGDYELYIFPREFIEKHEKDFRNKSKRFSSATHRIIFLETPSKNKQITSFDRIFKTKKEYYKNAWNLIDD